MNIQGWFPSGLTALISFNLQSKGLSRVFSSTTLQNNQFFNTQSSLWSSSHFCTWILGKNIALIEQTFVSMLSDMKPFLGQAERMKREHIFKTYNRGRINRCLKLTDLEGDSLENPMGGGAWWAAIHGVAKSRTRLSDFTFTFHFHALEKAMATHSSVLAWRIPGMGEPGGLPSMGLHRVRHDWSDLAAEEEKLGIASKFLF